ncbi:hypothetical protein Ddc_16612 [Ditylenchus destructor]|nr:hypothetical protein Ddc_16612 [Ditylenchus destructor]
MALKHLALSLPKSITNPLTPHTEGQCLPCSVSVVRIKSSLSLFLVSLDSGTDRFDLALHQSTLELAL